MKKLLLSILILFSFSNLYAQKKTAALAPMGSLGELNELEKRVIFNSLQESLSKYYVLASQKMYEKAEEEAFQEMDADECTESQCIAIIQELLQTEFFFMFEIVKAGSFQQMKITRVDLDGNRDVRTETCDNCSISQVNGKVDGLVKKLTVSEEIISTPIVEKDNKESQNTKPSKNITEDNLLKNKNQIRFDSNILGNYEFNQKSTSIQEYIDSASKAFNYFSFTFITSLNIGLGLSLIDLSFETNKVWDGSSYYKETTRTLDLSYLLYWDKFNLSFLLGFSYPFQNKIKVSTDSSRWEYEKKEYNLDGGGYFLNIGYPYEKLEIFISRKEITNSVDMFKNYYSSSYRGETKYRTYLKINTIGIGYSF